MTDLVMEKKLPLKVKLGYGVGGFGALMIFNNFILYAMFFFTDIVSFTPAFAGAIIAIGTLWDAVTDPIVGYLSDKRDPAKGRRRPFIGGFAIPLGIISMLLFTDFGFNPLMTKVYFIFMVLAFYTFQTLVDVPFTALGAELTQDYDERSKLSTMRSVFYVISILISDAFLIFVAFFADTFADGSWVAGFSYAGALCGILIIISLFISYKTTKGYELKDVGEVQKFNLKELLIEPFKNRPFRYVAGLFAFGIVALSVSATTAVYYFFNNLGWDENFLGLFLIATAVIGLGGIPIVNTLAQKISKKAGWVLVMGLYAIGVIIFPGFLWLDGATTTVGLVLFTICMGFGVNLIYQNVWAMIPDCIEVDEFKTGKRREGMFYGVISLIQKVSSAVAILLAGMGLTWVNYDAMLEVQTQSTLNGVAYLYAYGSAVPVIIAIIIGVLNPMNRERHGALTEALKNKKAGKEYSDEKFKAVL